jgi:hypothetical protein
MDTLIQVITIAGGLVALVKGVLDLLKESREGSQAGEALWKRPRIRVGVALVVVVAGVAWYASPRMVHVWSVQVWDVVLDQKGKVVFSREFVAKDGNGFSNAGLNEIAQWFAEQMRKRGVDLEQTGVKVRVRVPADLSNGRIELEATPPVAVDKHLVIVSGTGKARVRTTLSDETVRNLGRDFLLEIQPRGFVATQIRVKWGKALDKEVTVTPSAVRIGVEKVSGGPGYLPAKLIEHLSKQPRFQIQSPKSLERLRKSIAEKMAMMARNPAIQMALRTDLGVDYIISGSYDRRSR